MRFSLAAAVLVITSAAPALAQDRTLPAGSYRGLDAAIDAQGGSFNDRRAPFEGRSAAERSDGSRIRGSDAR